MDHCKATAILINFVVSTSTVDPAHRPRNLQSVVLQLHLHLAGRPGWVGHFPGLARAPPRRLEVSDGGPTEGGAHQTFTPSSQRGIGSFLGGVRGIIFGCRGVPLFWGVPAMPRHTASHRSRGLVGINWRPHSGQIAPFIHHAFLYLTATAQPERTGADRRERASRLREPLAGQAMAHHTELERYQHATSASRKCHQATGRNSSKLSCSNISYIYCKLLGST